MVSLGGLSMPYEKWIMKQSWKNVFFIHLPVSAPSLRPHIPSCLDLDVYEGEPWISLVLFTIEGIYLKGIPFSVVSAFPEINVRTYISYNKRPGVFFLSLDAKHWATYTIAKKWYHLPYYESQISVKQTNQFTSYNSIRKDRKVVPAEFKGTLKSLSETFYSKQNSLEYWLTERYYLYSSNQGKDAFRAKIHHEPWQLQEAKAEINANTLISSMNILPLNEDPIVHFSTGTNVLISNLNKL
jgi:uncharacterized protein YqjF (DUF2071 family)